MMSIHQGIRPRLERVLLWGFTQPCRPVIWNVWVHHTMIPMTIPQVLMVIEGAFGFGFYINWYDGKSW